LGESDAAAEHVQRAESRHFLWGALRHAGAVHSDEPAAEATSDVVDAAARYVAMTPCRLALLPLEEALGALDQPNMPGTVTEHPNWRMRLPGEAGNLLDASGAGPRLEAMKKRRAQA
jgi:4-alpha-glucanotransferase